MTRREAIATTATYLGGIGMAAGMGAAAGCKIEARMHLESKSEEIQADKPKPKHGPITPCTEIDPHWIPWLEGKK